MRAARVIFSGSLFRIAANWPKAAVTEASARVTRATVNRGLVRQGSLWAPFQDSQGRLQGPEHDQGAGKEHRRVDRTVLSERLGSLLTGLTDEGASSSSSIRRELPIIVCRGVGLLDRDEVGRFRDRGRISVRWGGGKGSGAEAVPDPVLDFADTGFPESILRKLQEAGFRGPTPVQAQGWPVALAGLDLVAIGETGSGKTLGYILPALARLQLLRAGQQTTASRGRREDYGLPAAPATVLVLAPTRELAQQIDGVLTEYSRGTKIRSVCLFGGASRNPQIQRLEQGVDVIIATPGRLIDLVDSGAADLRGCSYVVLDEADRMLDMGFEPQVRAILNQVPGGQDRQLLMWSATWPKEVRQLAEDLFDDGGNSSGRLHRHVHLTIGSPTEELQANRNISQNVHVVGQGSQKTRKLLELLRAVRNECEEAGRRMDKVLVFAQTKKTVDFVERTLRREGGNGTWGASSIHGDKTQRQRDEVMARFRSGKLQVLVATDVASRGLDVSDVCHVINYDHPPCAEDYVHRIGRTGRAGSKAACSVSHTFLTNEDMRLAGDLINVLEKAGQPVPDELRDLHAQFKEGHHQSRQGTSGTSRYHRRLDDRGFERFQRGAEVGGDRGRLRYNRSFMPQLNRKGSRSWDNSD